MSETAILSIMVAALMGGGAYADIATALAKAKEIRVVITNHT